MVKTVRIGNNEYNLKSSAYTMFSYKDKTGRDLLKDLNYIDKKQTEIFKLPEEEQNNAWLDEMSGILDMILRLAYIMILEQDKNFKDYNEWLKELDNLMNDMSWFTEVMEVALSPFSGRIKNSPKQ